MHKSISRDFTDRAVSHYYSSNSFAYTGQDEEASFCIDKCPHKKCKGICEEFKKFEKMLHKNKEGGKTNALSEM